MPWIVCRKYIFSFFYLTKTFFTAISIGGLAMGPFVCEIDFAYECPKGE